MLRHQRQRPMECVPTSVAILLDIPAASVVEAVLPSNVPSWARLMFTPQRWWESVEIMLDAGFGEGTGQSYKSMVCSNMTVTMTDCPAGKGLISIVKHDSLMGHCVAFADGIVYDPEDNQPRTWVVWRAMMSNWHIRAILNLET